MRAMKDSGVEWIGEMPREWTCCKQRFVLRLINGRAYSDDEFEQDGKYRILRVGNLFTNSTWYTSSMELEADKYCEYGDLLYSWSMSYGPAIWNGERVIFHYHIWKVKMLAKSDRKYIYYYLYTLSDALRAELHITTMSFVTMGVMNNSMIVIPSIPEQHRIAAYLDTACAQIDTVLDKTRASIEEYKKLKQAVITKAVTKGIRAGREMKDSGVEWIDEIPKEWEIRRGKLLFNETNERSQIGAEELLTVSHITGITPRSQKEVNMFMAESLADYKICHVGDIAANTMWMWQGAIGVSKYHGVISPSYNTYCQTAKAFDAEYLDYILRIRQLIDIYTAYSTGITLSRLRLYPEEFLSIRFIIPPLTEQQEIAAYLDEKCAAIDALIANKTAFLSKLETYKKSLIYEYVTGKREVQMSHA